MELLGAPSKWLKLHLGMFHPEKSGVLTLGTGDGAQFVWLGGKRHPRMVYFLTFISLSTKCR